MSPLCWGDAERTQKLKQNLRQPQDVGVHTLDVLATKERDTSSGSRTSCSSYDVSDDEEGSDDGSISSSDSRVFSPSGNSTADSTLDSCQAHWLKTESNSPQTYKEKEPARWCKTLQSAPYGLRRVVPVVELVPPSGYDLRSTNGLMKCVNNLAPLPTPDELSQKHLAFNELQRLVDLWLRRRVVPETGVDPSGTTATLLLGGSWHLKVGEAASDLDVVALMPRVITSQVFFTSLCDHLANQAAVSDLVARRKAAIPVLSFHLNRVRVDLLFARYAQPQPVPKHVPFLPGHDMQMMLDMDATSIRSLSVARVASLILELVPNANVFRSCLRVIRLWARRRGLYSNKTGFLGGVSYALLVCFVCQMFPRANVACLVYRFFSVFAAWQYPTPILVAHPSSDSLHDQRVVQWNPHYNLHDRTHLMPIITPGFPAVNTAVNVNISTLKVLREEFARGQRIMDDLRRRSLSHPSSWTQLFAPTEMLVRYDHYVAIELRAPSDATLAEWASFVASRIRKLVITLQYTPSIASLHPLPDLVRSSDTSNGRSGYYLIGYTVNAPEARPPHASKPDHESLAKQSVALATRYFLATELDMATEKKFGMEIAISDRAWTELPNALFPSGRTAAISDRAQYFLRQAHHVNLALGLAR